MACPLARGVSPSTSFEMGHSSRQIFSCFIRSMTYGCLVSANPWPIRLDLRSSASSRLSSVSEPVSSVSPQWKRKGISTFSRLQSFWNCRNSGMKKFRGLPLPSSPTRSNPAMELAEAQTWD